MVYTVHRYKVAITLLVTTTWLELLDVFNLIGKRYIQIIIFKEGFDLKPISRKGASVPSRDARPCVSTQFKSQMVGFAPLYPPYNYHF